jgi:hypothetical protein
VRSKGSGPLVINPAITPSAPAATATSRIFAVEPTSVDPLCAFDELVGGFEAHQP